MGVGQELGGQLPEQLIALAAADEKLILEAVGGIHGLRAGG
jgi:hypothetical protein